MVMAAITAVAMAISVLFMTLSNPCASRFADEQVALVFVSGVIMG